MTMASVAPSSSTPTTSRRGIRGWMFFDWAAQPFFTVVTTFIFGPYFVSRLTDDPALGQATWGYGIAAAGLMIGILSPILGSIADQTGRRKPWIAFFAVLQVCALSMLWFAVPGSALIWPIIFYVIAAVSAEFSIVFNDSMLPKLVSKQDIGRVSNQAWGLGYAGGMIALIIVITLLAGSAETGKTLIGIDPLFGLDQASGEDARIVGPFAAVWYLLFILPMFFFTPDSKRGAALVPAVRLGLSELKATLGEVRTRAGILRFLIARMLYQDGVNALLALGGAFAAMMFGWSILELGIYGIILNVVAILGCIIAGKIDAGAGSKIVVQISLVLLILATIGIVSTTANSTLFGLINFAPSSAEGLFATMAEKAYILYGLLIGFAFGPVQASSRSYLARSVPVEDAGRYFGLYALSGRATSFLAPFLVATVTAISKSPALGMSVIILFLLAGYIILMRTPYPADKV